MKTVQITIKENDIGVRLDTFVANQMPDLTRSRVHQLIEQGHVLVSGRTEKPGYKTKVNNQIEVSVPASTPIDRVQAEEIPIEIIYEDKDLAVINKSKGMVVHPAPGHHHGTLVNALLHRCNDLSGINGEIRPGIVHRLDKDTSGAIIIAKNDQTHVALAQQIAKKSAQRIYWALVDGKMKNETFTIDAPIARHPVHRKKMAIVQGGRNAVTHIEVLEQYEHYALIEARLETGRTHQIRVHMAHIGHPIVGDFVYGRKKNSLHLFSQALHAKYLTFFHPTKQVEMTFEAPLPEYFFEALKKLRNKFE